MSKDKVYRQATRPPSNLDLHGTEGPLNDVPAASNISL